MLSTRSSSSDSISVASSFLTRNDIEMGKKLPLAIDCQSGGNNNAINSTFPVLSTKTSAQKNTKPNDKKASKRSTELIPNAIIFKLQPIYEGHLTFKRKRRWVILDDANLYVFKSVEDFKVPMIISLHCSAVRKQLKENLVAFEILTAGQNYLFFPDKDAANRTIDLWIEKIQDVCERIVLTSIEGKDVSSSSTTSNHEVEKKMNRTLSPEHQDLIEIASLEGNLLCADCKAKFPEWASINLGVFICIECSGIHRSFGTHISKVRSVKLDKWEQSWVNEMKRIGNIKSNEIWEFAIPPEFEPINESSNLDERKKWLNLKYVEGRFRKDWEEKKLEKNRSANAGIGFLNNSEFKEFFLHCLRDDAQFVEDIKKILLQSDT